MTKKQDQYTQIGITALRSPTGEFLPAVPLFIKTEDGAEQGEESLIKDIGQLFASRMRQYRNECAAAGVEP